MRVVYRDHQRPGSREVGGEPVQAVENGERNVTAGALSGLTREHSFGRRGRAREQRPALLRRGQDQAPFKQLAYHAEGEPGLQLRATRAHHLVPEAGRALGGGRQQRRLAYAGAAFYHENTALDQHSIQGGELVLPLEQPHGANTNRKMTAQPGRRQHPALR